MTQPFPFLRPFLRRLTPRQTALLAPLAAMALVLGLPAPAHAWGWTTIEVGHGADLINGSGKTVAVARKLGNFSVLRIDGPLDVVARPGAAAAVVVHADDNIEPLVETTVEGDALVVRLRKGASFRTHERLFVEVSFTTLSAVQQTGSGDLRISALKSPRLDATVSGSGDLAIADAQLGSLTLAVHGSGDVTLAGQADEARIEVHGSGDVTATALVARHVEASTSGSGDIHVTATDSLVAQVSGSGDIGYAGHPHDVSRRVRGSGSISAIR